MDEPQVNLSDVIRFVEALGKRDIEFDWQRSKNAYYQYMIEVQTLGILTPEQWFLDEGRLAERWPQAIVSDYLRYHKQLAEAEAARNEKNEVQEALAKLQDQVAALEAQRQADAAEIARLKEAQVPVLTETPAPESDKAEEAEEV